MRLNSKALMIMILGFMLLSTLFGALHVSDKSEKQDSVIIDHLPDDRPVNNKTDNVVDGDTYLRNFLGADNLDNDIKKLIIDYMNDYYESISNLEVIDTSKHFDNELSASISNNAIKLLVEVRKLYDYDFSISKAHYDLTVTRYQEADGYYYVDILEDDYMYFSFLDDIESSAYDIENYFVISKTDDGYKIHDLEKVQGYYNCFYDECENIDDVNERYAYMYGQLKDMISYNYEVLKNKAANNPYKSDLSYTKEYDRQEAVSYLDKYYHTRNAEWFNYSDVGGNCQNYASQALLKGGIPMDFYGEQQWKCYSDSTGYDPDVDESESATGRSRSWVNVGYFYDYAKYNEGTGLVSDVGANINYGEPGDIVIVGNSTLAHTVMISKVIDGHILVNSNSIDMKDFPLDAYTYTNVILIKILGYNQYQ